MMSAVTLTNGSKGDTIPVNCFLFPSCIQWPVSILTGHSSGGNKISIEEENITISTQLESVTIFVAFIQIQVKSLTFYLSCEHCAICDLIASSDDWSKAS